MANQTQPVSATPILATKLYIPPQPPDQVPRPHLIRRLEAGRTRKLTLITAPAGFGKTTLAVAWLAQAEQPVAWLSLDENDNEPGRMFAHLVAAIQQLYPGVCKSVLAMLRSPTPSDAETLLAALINELVECEQRSNAAPAPFFLVLDDYHLIENEWIHAGIRFLLTHLPPSMHIVITSRAEPPLPLARLRARNQISELRQRDLRFSAEEIAAFVQVRAGVALTREEVETLLARTEGWVAALQFVVLSLQGSTPNRSQAGVARAVRSISGRDRHVVDYLLAEVLQQQPAELQHFLLQTSILERMNAVLCDHLLAEVVDAANAIFPDSREMLAAVERLNLFIIPLDNERRWYRYHHLFAELLRHQLHQQCNDAEIAALHRRASHWFQEQGFFEEAIEHALAAGDDTLAAQWMELSASRILWGRGTITRLWRWVEQLPQAVLKERPALLLAATWSHLNSADAAGVERYLQMLLELPHLPDGIQAQVYVAQATMLEADGRKAEAHRLARLAIETVPDDDAETRAIVYFLAHVSLLREVYFTSVQPWMVQALDAARASKNYYVAGYIMRFFVWVAFARGELHHAYELCHEALQMADSHRTEDELFYQYVEGESVSVEALPATGFAYFSLADVYYEWNQLEQAAVRYEAARIISEQTRINDLVIAGHLYQAEEMIRLGEADKLRAELSRLRNLVQQTGLERLLRDFARLEAHLSLRAGDLDVVARWLDENRLTLETVKDNLEEESDCAILLRYLLARSLAEDDALYLDGVQERLAHLLKEARQIEYVGAFIRYGLVLALVFQQQAQTFYALAVLEEVLDAAALGGYIRTFLRMGLPMRDLLRLSQSHSQHSAYVQQLLDAFDAEPAFARSVNNQSTSPEDAENPLVEPLTPRELEVLGLVASGLKNSEIAAELVVSIGTVKRHISNMYGKLGVDHRAAAVARARELSLV